MKVTPYIGIALASCLAIYVTACGDNPTKSRTLSDSLDQETASLPTASLTSIDGKTLSFDKGSSQVKASMDDSSISLQFSYNYEGNVGQLELSSGDTFSVQSAELGAGYNDLKAEIDAEVKKTGLSREAVESRRPYRRGVVDWTCTAEASGEIVSWIKRPKEINANYQYSQALNLFTSEPKATSALTMRFPVEATEYNIQLNLSGKEVILDDYLTQKPFQDIMKKVCADTWKVQQGFSSFFYNRSADSGYGSSVSESAEFLVGIEKLDAQQLKLSAGNSNYNSAEHAAFRYFLAPKKSVDLTTDVKALFESGNFKSNRLMTYSVDDVLDPRLELQVDWEASEILMSREGKCGFQLKGKFEPFLLKTDAQPGPEASLISKVKLSKPVVLSKEDQCGSISQDIESGELTLYLRVDRDSSRYTLDLVNPENYENYLPSVVFTLEKAQ